MKLPVAYDSSGRLFGAEEMAELADVIAAGALTRWGGTKADAFESAWAAKLGVPHAVAVSSGSAALHVALAALELPPGGEVITSPVTDMGTVIGIAAAGLRPVFADVDPGTGMITAATVAARIGPDTVAVLPVHLFGRCADDLTGLGVPVVEDASQAHFARRDGVHAGTSGVFGCFSLQQSKVVSCGEGGIVVTADAALAERARLFQNKGWRRGETGDRAYPFLGMNYRLGELNAAVALAQLRKADEILARRRATHAVVADALRDHPALRVLGARPGEEPSWWALAIQGDRPARAPFAAGTHAVHRARAVRDRGWGTEKLPGTEAFLARTMTMNWNEGITVADAERIAAAVAR